MSCPQFSTRIPEGQPNAGLCRINPGFAQAGEVITEDQILVTGPFSRNGGERIGVAETSAGTHYVSLPGFEVSPETMRRLRNTTALSSSPQGDLVILDVNAGRPTVAINTSQDTRTQLLLDEWTGWRDTWPFTIESPWVSPLWSYTGSRIDHPGAAVFGGDQAQFNYARESLQRAYGSRPSGDDVPRTYLQSVEHYAWYLAGAAAAGIGTAYIFGTSLSVAITSYVKGLINFFRKRGGPGDPPASGGTSGGGQTVATGAQDHSQTTLSRFQEISLAGGAALAAQGMAPTITPTISNFFSTLWAKLLGLGADSGAAVVGAGLMLATPVMVFVTPVPTGWNGSDPISTDDGYI